MEKDSNYYRQLLEKWLNSRSSPQEAIELMDYLQTDSSSRILLQKLQEEFPVNQELMESIPSDVSDRIRTSLLNKMETVPLVRLTARKGKMIWLRIAAAVVLVMGIGTAVYFGFSNSERNKELSSTQIPSPVQNDVPAGTNKAILTLADGTRIELDEHAKGRLDKPGLESVINNDGQLVYEKNELQPGGEVYNTLTSARGQSYSLVLADGSKLWLNAASSVRFPVAFAANERKVEITGEVYFEVAKDSKKPFRVKAQNMEIEVLGTQFDINAYPDETSINTTLIEGSVKVYANNKNLQLSPGQQSRFSSNGNLNLLTDVNIDEIVAWKNGYFHFDNADLRSILRQFSRWYDIEIVYEGEVKNRKFLAIVSRNSSLASVLKMLNANNIEFKIEGKKLIVQSS